MAWTRLLAVGLLALGLVSGACSGVPARVPPPPQERIPMPAAVSAVRRAVRAEAPSEALRLLQWERPLRVEEPERIFLLVRLAAAGCQEDALRRRTWRLPRGEVGDAMRALAAEDAGRALGELSTQQGTVEHWRELVAGFLHAERGERDRALRAGTRALASRRDFVRHEAWLLRGRLLLGEGDLAGVHACADQAARIDPSDARPPRLRADAFKAAGRMDEAALALLEALRIAPESPRYAHRLADTLRRGVADATWQRVDEGCATLAGGTHAHAERVALRALLEAHTGRADDAIVHYRHALHAGAIPVPLVRELRHLLAQRGRWAESHALLVDSLPPGADGDPHNLLRERWHALQRAAAASPGPSAPEAARAALGRALVGVGALDEAVAVLATVPRPEARALERRVQGHLALEAGLRAWIEAGYNAAKRQQEPPSFESGLRVLGELARRHLPPDEQAAFVEPARGLRELPLLGSWLDHATHTSSPVVAHFRRYGRFLLFGRQGDVPVEAIVLSLAVLSADRPITTVGAQYRHDVAIGYDRVLRSNIAAQGGMLGGACLADGIWIDAATARHTEHELRRALTGDPSLLPAARASAPPLPDTLEGVFALTDPGCTAVRLLARYAARRPDDMWGSYGTLVAHEFGHVADIRRHLPILPKLPNTLGLLWRGGLDFGRVQRELEMRAQLGACVDAPDPDLALAEMLFALPVRALEPEEHDGGYLDGLRALLLHIHARPDLYPQIDRSRRLLNQLDRLDNEQIRQAARAVLGR